MRMVRARFIQQVFSHCAGEGDVGDKLDEMHQPSIMTPFGEVDAELCSSSDV
jgi:hypothetical protein